MRQLSWPRQVRAPTPYGRCQLRPGHASACAGKDEEKGLVRMTATLFRTPATPASGLVCRNCGAGYPLGAQHACIACFGPLEIGYSDDRLASVTRQAVEAGPQSLWRYA